MSAGANQRKNQHALNLFVSWEIKRCLQETAERFDRTVADIVRMALKMSLPILQGLCQAQERLLAEQIKLFRCIPGSPYRHSEPADQDPKRSC
jgi:hypothetical protein